MNAASFDVFSRALLGSFLLVSLALIYILLRQRDARGERHDPQLGMKTALHFFLSMALLILLVGLAVIAEDLASSSTEFWSAGQRTGTALALAGILFSSLHWLLLRFGTNDREWPAARRMLIGWRFAIHSFVVIAVTTLLLLEVFEKAQTRSDDYRRYFAWLCIWGPSWLIHLVLLWYHSAKEAKPGPAVSWDAD